MRDHHRVLRRLAHCFSEKLRLSHGLIVLEKKEKYILTQKAQTSIIFVVRSHIGSVNISVKEGVRVIVLVLNKLLYSKWSPYAWSILCLLSLLNVFLYWRIDKSGAFLFLWWAIMTGLLAIDMWIAKITRKADGPIKSFALSLLHR